MGLICLSWDPTEQILVHRFLIPPPASLQTPQSGMLRVPGWDFRIQYWGAYGRDRFLLNHKKLQSHRLWVIPTLF